MIIPDYDAAARKAEETYTRYSVGPFPADPLQILRRLPRVLLISCDAPVDQDAFTCVQRRNGHLCYIIYYNPDLPHYALRSALARQLAHVILQHDGTVPESVWTEEANCFAYHFLCYRPPVRVVINFRPVRSTLSSSFKAMQTFDSMDALKAFVAETHTKLQRFIGKADALFHPSDVEILSLDEKDVYGGWKNYSSVVVAGRPVGYCGE